MAPTSSTDLAPLLAVARRAIETELALQRWRPALDGQPAELTRPGACFVTLTRRQRLRGCIGSLEPERPLVIDTAVNAVAAAFRDPRFPPLGNDELDDLDIEISVLLPAETLPVTSRRELLELLAPGRDGLIVAEGSRRATFLPSVWAQLADPESFVSHLFAKAGLATDHWSPTLVVRRYRTISIRQQGTR